MIKITDPDSLERMALVEGNRWLLHQADNTGPYGFYGFLREFREQAEGQYAPGEHLSIDGNTVIYGASGYHRYFVVASTGEIWFSRYRASSDDAVRKAQEVGFSITRTGK